MKKLMNRAGLLAAAFALALAVALALNAAAQIPAEAQTPAVGMSVQRFDELLGGRDPNGLIDITTPAQLNAIRYDKDGDGYHDDDTGTKTFSRSKCAGQKACKGYELAADISLASYNDGAWVPIEDWGGFFEGNMFRITGLKVKDNPGNDGLFSVLDSNAVVKHVMVDAEIESSGGRTGALAGANNGTIIGSYAKGKLTASLTSSSGSGAMGGLVGYNRGKIYASVAKVEVKVKGLGHVMRAGGFVGVNRGEIRQSYAYGDVIEIWNGHSDRVDLYGFGKTQFIRGGKVDRSISYGDLTVKDEDSDTAIINTIESRYPAPFGGDDTNSCVLRHENVVICPTPTPTPTGD